MPRLKIDRKDLSRTWVAHRLDLLVLGLYVGLTLLVTYPVVTRLSTHLAGSSVDAFAHLWSLWWAKEAWLDLHTSLSNLSLFYYPVGVQLPILAVTPMVQLAELPLATIFKPVLAYNLTLLLTFILTAFFTYILCYQITGSRLAAFLGGWILAYAPVRAYHALGHMAQVTTYWFPLYALAVVKFFDRLTWKRSLWLGVLLGISSLVNFVHTAYFVLPFTAYWLVYFVVSHRRQIAAWWRQLAAAMLLAAAISLAFFIPYLVAQHQLGSDYLSQPGVISFSANPLGFVTPSPAHPLVARLGLSETFTDWIGGGVGENWVYMGILPLVLGLGFIIKRKKQAAFWLGFGLLAAVLSMGPVLKIGREVIGIPLEGRTIELPLPYLLYQFVPLLDTGRTPARIALGTSLALAVLASQGMAMLLSRLPGRKRRLAFPITALAVLLLTFEYWPYSPFMTTPATTPSFYEQVRDEEGEFAIFDYPLHIFRPGTFHEFKRPMFYQITHQRPIEGGKVWRLPYRGKQMLLMHNSLVGLPSAESLDIFQIERTDEQRVAWLSAMGFRYLVVHKMNPGNMSPDWFRPESEVLEDRNRFSALLGEPVYEDDLIIAYRIPDGLQVHDVPLAAVGDGWWDIDGTPPQRWMSEAGRISAYVLEPADYRLAFDALPFPRAHQITVSLNGEPLMRTMVAAQRWVTTPVIHLNPGLSEIEIRSDDGCVRPSDVDTTSSDTRCLSIQSLHFKWVAPDAQYGQISSGVRFGDYFRLLGYDLDNSDARPGGAVGLTLHWEILRPADLDYTTFIHLVDPAGVIHSQEDSQPCDTACPTTSLGAGEIIGDSFTLPLDDNAALGSYSVVLGWYDWVTGNRLPVHDAGADTDHLLLSLVELQSEE